MVINFMKVTEGWKEHFMVSKYENKGMNNVIQIFGFVMRSVYIGKKRILTMG